MTEQNLEMAKLCEVRIGGRFLLNRLGLDFLFFDIRGSYSMDFSMMISQSVSPDE